MSLYKSNGLRISTYADGAEGIEGNGIQNIENYYYASTSNNIDDIPAVGNTKWKKDIGQLSEPFNTTNKYLWNYELVSYTKPNTEPTNTGRIMIAIYSKDGKGIQDIHEYYLLTETVEAPVTLPTIENNNGWTKATSGTTIPTPTKDLPYLWNYEIIDYTEGQDTTSGPVCIGTYGNSIVETIEYYLATNTNNPPEYTDEGWDKNIANSGQGPDKPYLWNYEEVKYSISNSTKTPITLLSASPRQVEEVTEYYQQLDNDTNPSNGATWPTTDTNHNSAPNVEGWSTTRGALLPGKVMWNIEVIKYSTVDNNGKNLYTATEPAQVGYAGTNGSPALDFNITADSYVFKKASPSATTYTNTITLTAHKINITGSVKWYKDNTSTTSVATGDSYQPTTPGIYWAACGDWKDSVVIGEVADGGIGPDGKPAISIVLSNPNMTFHAQTADESEICEVIVYEGDKKLTSTATSGARFSITEITDTDKKASISGSKVTISDPENDGFCTIQVNVTSSSGATSNQQFNIYWTVVDDGKSPYTISLDDDFSSIPADHNGNISTTWSTTVSPSVFYGFTRQTDWSNNSNSGLGIFATGINLTATYNSSSKTYTINKLTAPVGSVSFVLKLNGTKVAEAKFEAVKQIAGTPATPPPTLQIYYKNDTSTPTTPTGTPPSGWSPSITAPTGNQKTYMVQKMSNESTWSTPIQISGLDGIGVDGDSIVYKYCRKKKNESAPQKPGVSTADTWTESPLGVTDVYVYEYVSVATKDGATGNTGSWSTPVIWSKWGEKGQDGDGITYIYTRNDTGEPPTKPISYASKGSAWTDDPQGVSETYPYEYVVQIKNVGTSSETLTNTKLWAKWSSDGEYVYAKVSPNVLHKSNITDINIELYKRSGSGQPQLYTTKAYYTRIIDGGTESRPIEFEGTYTLTKDKLSNLTQSLQINIYNKSNKTEVIDKITIDVLEDGESAYYIYHDKANSIPSVPTEKDYTKIPKIKTNGECNGWYTTQTTDSVYSSHKIATSTTQANEPWGPVTRISGVTTTYEDLWAALDEQTEAQKGANGIYTLPGGYIAINADLIKTGAFKVENDGAIIFSADASQQQVRLADFYVGRGSNGNLPEDLATEGANNSFLYGYRGNKLASSSEDITNPGSGTESESAYIWREDKNYTVGGMVAKRTRQPITTGPFTQSVLHANLDLFLRSDRDNYSVTERGLAEEDVPLMRRINGVYIGPEGIGVGRASMDGAGYYGGNVESRTFTENGQTKTYYVGSGYDQGRSRFWVDKNGVTNIGSGTITGNLNVYGSISVGAKNSATSREDGLYLAQGGIYLGKPEANSDKAYAFAVTTRGELYATKGQIGGMQISSIKSEIDTANSTANDAKDAVNSKMPYSISTGNYTWNFDSDNGIIMKSGTEEVFRVGQKDGVSGLWMKGGIEATYGKIAGWDIGSNNLSSVKNLGEITYEHLMGDFRFSINGKTENGTLSVIETKENTDSFSLIKATCKVKFTYQLDGYAQTTEERTATLTLNLGRKSSYTFTIEDWGRYSGTPASIYYTLDFTPFYEGKDVNISITQTVECWNGEYVSFANAKLSTTINYTLKCDNKFLLSYDNSSFYGINERIKLVNSGRALTIDSYDNKAVLLNVGSNVIFYPQTVRIGTSHYTLKVENGFVKAEEKT